MSDARRLCLSPPQAFGRALWLEEDDVLIAVNGEDFTGDTEALVARFAMARGQPLALTFLRAGQPFTVLAATPDLGEWTAQPLEVPPYGGPALNPDRLINWEVFRTADGLYDLHALRGSLLALIAPPVWMLLMRLWAPAGAMVAAGMLTAAVSPLMLLALWLVAGLHLWSSGTAYVRRDRLARGMTACRILAAPGESAAHLAYLRAEPTARFLFSRPVPEGQPG